MVPFVCKQCGTEGECFPSQARTFCSQSCRSRWNSDNKPMPSKPRRGSTVACMTCGADVYRMKSEPTKQYCSIECHSIGQRNGEQRTCEGCETTFYVVPSQAERRYCTRSCYEATRIRRSSAGRIHNGREVIRDHSGYLRIWEPGHPSANQGRVLEHRWVMEQSIGRYLATDEHVHHVNGVKDDNRLDNLQVMDAQEHRLLTTAEVKARRASDADELAEYRRRFGPLNQ